MGSGSKGSALDPLKDPFAKGSLRISENLEIENKE